MWIGSYLLSWILCCSSWSSHRGAEGEKDSLISEFVYTYTTHYQRRNKGKVIRVSWCEWGQQTLRLFNKHSTNLIELIVTLIIPNRNQIRAMHLPKEKVKIKTNKETGGSCISESPHLAQSVIKTLLLRAQITVSMIFLAAEQKKSPTEGTLLFNQYLVQRVCSIVHFV